MNELNSKSEEINIIITYESQQVSAIKCSKDTVMEDILKNFALQMNLELTSLIFLYGGDTIGNLKLSFFQLMSEEDKKIKEMNILAYNITKSMIQNQNQNQQTHINIIFRLESISNTVIVIKKIRREESLKNICNEYASENGLIFNSLIFKYEGKEIDINKKFDDIANKYDKNCYGMSILVSKKNLLKINFLYKNNPPYPMECYKEDKIKDVLNIYAINNNLNLNKLSFKYGLVPITLDNSTFNDLIINYDTNSKITFNNTTKLFSDNNEDTIDKIDLIVNDIIETPVSFCKKYKYLIIILSIVIIVILIILLVVLLLNGNENGPIIIDSTIVTDSDSTIVTDSDSTMVTDSDSTIVPKICDDGYFLPYDDKTLQDCQKCSLEGCVKCNGTYKNNECTSCGNLKSVYYNNKIIKCNKTCEIGDEEKCLTCYTDKIECKTCNIGYKLVNGKCKPDYFIKAIYYSSPDQEEVDLINLRYLDRVSRMIIDGKNIAPTSKYNFPKEGYHTIFYKFKKVLDNSGVTSLFSGLDRIFSVNFSEFNEYIPDITFENMFSGCTNLTSVDLSKITLNLNFNANNMFQNCINLKYLNFNLNKLNIKYEAQYMFYNCKSLTSIDLSRLNVSTTTNFEYMFYGCKSLKSINLKSFNLEKATNIDNMFYNCESLISLDLSNFIPLHLEQMSGVFRNCISLTSINLNYFYTHNVKKMDYLFYNCTSLKYINISEFNTKKVSNFNSMFGYCNSLTSIEVSKKNFITNKLVDMNSMFTHCYSLTSIDLINFNTTLVTNMSCLFSDCYSLKSIDVSNFKTYNVQEFSYMFYNCYSLTSIDVLHFKYNNIVDKYIFAGCYSLTSISIPFHNGYYLFHNCTNLNYVNISSFDSYSTDGYLFNKNISSNGTLILTREYYQKAIARNIYIPSNWTLIFV